VNDLTDSQLLRVYAAQRSEAAFAELVRRHVDLVYSAALRMLRDAHLAEDVTQGAFLALSQQSAKLMDRPVLSGWLHYTARNIAAQTVRTIERRRAREQECAAMNDLLAQESDDAWEHIVPHLDAALGKLNEADRDALLLRYFERKSAHEMAQTLGISDEAAQKRVTRAVERLRKFFAQRGVTVGASGLVVAISTNAVQAAPVGLAAAISTSARLATATLLTTATATSVKIITMTTTQKTLITIGLLVFLSIASYKVFHTNELRNGSLEAGVALETNEAGGGKVAKRFEPFGATANRDSQAVTPDILKLRADLRTELHEVPHSPHGTLSYPPDNVVRAVLAFGTARKEAFTTLLDAVNDPGIEVRMRAISVMGYIGKAATAQMAQFGIVGEPALEAKPLLWKVLLENDPNLAPIALSSLRTIGFEAREIPDLTELMTQPVSQELRRYLPEAIAKIIQTDPSGAAPFVSTVEFLLNQSDPGVQFEAACALAKHEAAGNPQILAVLEAGLKSPGPLQQLMALETLQGLGSVAEPALQTVLDFADATTDDVLKDLAFKTIGKINSGTRSGLPEVEEVLKHEESIANWNEKFVSGNYTQQDLIDALKEPMFSVKAAIKLGELGSLAKETIPDLVSALAGQDQTAREEIVDAIHQIDPETVIAKIAFPTIASASIAASLTLESNSGQSQPTPLAKLLEKSLMGNSEWQTQQEVVTLAKAIAAQNQEAYRVFADKLLEVEPNLANLIPKRTAK